MTKKIQIDNIKLNIKPFISNKTMIFNTLERAKLMLNETSAKSAQYFLERELEHKLTTNPLPYLGQVNNNRIKESKAHLNDAAKKILEKSRLPEELKTFMTSELLTAISLTILTKLFHKASAQDSRISQTALIRAILDHFVRQLSLQRDKEIYKEENDGEKTKLKKSSKKKEEQKILKTDTAARTLAAKIVGVLSNPEIDICRIYQENPYSKSPSRIRTTNYLCLSDEWVEVAKQYENTFTCLPMLCPPLTWELQETNPYNKIESIIQGINLRGGGYLTDSEIQKNKTALLKNATAMYVVCHSEESKDNLNYIQSLGFRINNDLLKIIKENKLLIPNYKESYMVAQQTRKEYCGSMFKTRRAEEHDSATNYLAETDFAIDIADKLQGLDLHFAVRHDGRGRIYTIAYPISPISANYMRSILTCKEDYYFSKKTDRENWESLVLKLTKDLMGNNTKKSVELFKKNPGRAFDKALSDVEVIDDFSLHALKDIFINEGGQTSQLIGLDVTASGLQIMGLITRCTKALEMTQVFDQNETNSAVDIYHAIQKHVVKKYPIVQEMDRKTYKGIIMRMSYGEGVYSRKKTLYEYLKTLENEEFKKNKNKGTLLLDMAKAYDQAIYKEFPKFKTFTDQADKIVSIRTKLNLGINFNISNIFKTNQYYNMDKATTYSFRDFDGKSKRITMYIPEKITSSQYERYEAKPNTRKIKRATLPNFIHHIDSLLAHLVIKEFRKELKPLFTVHDAFYVRLIDMAFLKEAYFQALQQIHDLDPWSKFLETNKITLEDLRNDHWSEEDKALAEDLNHMIDNWMITREAVDFKRPRSNRILS
uniref:DNA-directed RNA polymerase n=1 Tax=Pylaiella littoralis TaxID=2885 RepID=O78798_PYLLI|nr:RNA polymerase [Pylaiella littoralis]AAC23956.1 T7-like RNA polymerase [Pylaiella littoralis]CAC50862.1 T7-like RNA polymerase [Pylaiella littoralis]